MVWLPPARTEVVRLATPPLKVPVPIGLPPSRNVTDPVGVPVPGGTAVTVAVNVTDWPTTEGFTDDVTAVAVLALLTTCGFPVIEPVLPLKVASPRQLVVMG